MGIDLAEKKSSDASVRATATVEMPLGTFFCFAGRFFFFDINTSRRRSWQITGRKKKKEPADYIKETVALFLTSETIASPSSMLDEGFQVKSMKLTWSCRLVLLALAQSVN